MKSLIFLTILVAVTNGQISNKAQCTNEAMDSVRSLLPVKYIEQVNKMIECKNPNVTEVCFKKAYGQPEPNSIEEIVSATCTTSSYEQMMQKKTLIECIESSDELLYNILMQSMNHWECMWKALTVQETGSLCQVAAESGAEASVSFLDPVMAQLGLNSVISKIKRTIPGSISHCFNYHMVDLICDANSFQSMANCMSESVTMKSLKDWQKNLERIQSRRRQTELDPELIAAILGHQSGRRNRVPPNDWTTLLNN